MKKSIQFLLLAVMAVSLASCDMFNRNDPSYRLEDLQGLWLQDDDPTEHYVRFTTEQSDETGYLLAREWNEYHGDEDQAVYESDLLEQRNRDGFPGNGWFKYEFKTTGDLTEIHLMDNGGAEIPKVYIVSKLTDTELAYYEKDRKNLKYSYSRVTETK